MNLEKSILSLLNNIDQYKPREFIEENLSLENCTNQFIDFFEQINTQDTKRYNYQKLSKILFYSGLICQIWAWKWLWGKIYK